MRRLILVAAVALALPACRPRDKIRPEPTEENLNLLSEVHMTDPAAARQLIRGFHPLEQNSWRWTQGKFAVILQPPAGSDKTGAQLHVQLTVPPPVIDRLKGVTLSVLLKGVQLGSATWRSAGEYTFSADIPAALLGAEPVTFDFVLDRFLAAGAADSRELGLIVSSVGLRKR